MNKRILILSLFFVVFSNNCFGWLFFQRDKLTIQNSHSEIFLKHIRPEENNSINKNEEKQIFVESLNQKIKKRKKTSNNLMQLIPEQLIQYDEIKINMHKNSNFSLENIDLEFTKNTGQYLETLVLILQKQEQNILNNINSQEDENIKQKWIKQSKRLLKFSPIVDNLLRIFKFILILKDQKTLYTLQNVYEFVESKVNPKIAKEYFSLGAREQQVYQYASSNVELEKVKTYLAQGFSLEEAYKHAQTDLSPKLVQGFIALSINRELAIKLTDENYNPEETKQFIDLGFTPEQAIKLTKMENISRKTIKTLLSLGQKKDDIIKNLKLD